MKTFSVSLSGRYIGKVQADTYHGAAMKAVSKYTDYNPLAIEAKSKNAYMLEGRPIYVMMKRSVVK